MYLINKNSNVLLGIKLTKCKLFGICSTHFNLHVLSKMATCRTNSHTLTIQYTGNLNQ